MNESQLPKIGKKQPLSEQAYAAVKEGILTNTLKAKDVLLEETLCNMLGISKTPLRVALTRLEAEKLVVFNSAKQAVVAELSTEDVSDLFCFRFAVEPSLASIASTMLTDEYAEKLEECLSRSEEANVENDLFKIVARELEFDKILAACVDNGFFTSSITMIHSHLQRLLSRAPSTYRDARHSLVEHRMILAALKEKKAKEAATLTRRHLRNVIIRCEIDFPGRSALLKE